MSEQGFVPGMRAKGECPKHPGQPFYHCPECSRERRQAVGDQIADSLETAKPENVNEEIIADPVPVHITRRAFDHLLARTRSFYRNRLEGKIAQLKNRIKSMDDCPERDVAERALAKLQEKAIEGGVDPEGFEVVVRVYIDILGESGVTPDIKLAEPGDFETFERDYRIYEVGSLKIAVERQHMNYLTGLIIDWIDKLDGSGFDLRHSRGEWKKER